MKIEPTKPTIFFVTDIETTLRHRITFDVAWRAIDRKGRIYDEASYLVNEAFALDIPYFKQKIGDYLIDAYDHVIQPVSIWKIREHYNDMVHTFKSQGHKVVFAAYNAGFDARYLGQTSLRFTEKQFLAVPIWLLDIWHYWVLSAPQAYNYATEKGNPKTSAEYVYRFETQNPAFQERHIAWSDVGIEAEILLKTLARKQAMPLVANISELNGQPWRLLLDRPVYQNGETIPVWD